jgi:hypothetical protein
VTQDIFDMIYADKLLRYVSAVIAHPHATITEHDKHRALEIIRYINPDEEIVEHLYSQMNQDDFKQVKNIREHARNAIK